MKKLTVVTIVGTRPEIIRLSRLIPKLDSTFDHIFVHTGQNYDPKLNDVFFEDLELRKPDYYLDVDASSLGSVMGDTLKKVEPIFLKHKPDAVCILGDTNSAVAALLAKRMHIPVYHMEAGNRSFDENVPEESNRRMVDHVSDFNLPYNTYSYENLRNEGIHPRRLLKTGSPMREIFKAYLHKIQASSVLDTLKLEKGKYFLVSAHRQENVDNPNRLRDLLQTLMAVHEKWRLPVLVSTHPRTRKQLEAVPGFSSIQGVIFHEPFGFIDYNKLQLNALAVISDSGTISEEATILGFPAITIRDSMERPEALEVAGVVMTGLSEENVIAGLEEVIANQKSSQGTLPEGYEVENFSERVVRFILSTASRHHEWAGIRKQER
jgi:UDP-N-acetylglucosamine 2-epimerase (non-hydrolysing)